MTFEELKTYLELQIERTRKQQAVYAAHAELPGISRRLQEHYKSWAKVVVWEGQAYSDVLTKLFTLQRS